MRMSHVFREMLRHNLALVNGHLQCSWSVCGRGGGCGWDSLPGRRRKNAVESTSICTVTPPVTEGRTPTPCLPTLLRKRVSVFYTQPGLDGSAAWEGPTAAFHKPFRENTLFLFIKKGRNPQVLNDSKKKTDVSGPCDGCTQPSPP